jgi:TonB family protein
MKFGLPRVLRRALNAFPDVNQQPPKQQATVGLVGSVLLHLGALLLWLSVESGWIDNLLVAPEKPPNSADIIIQTVTPSLPEKVVLPLDQLVGKPRMDSAGLLESKTDPLVPAFQSDRNLAAGSQQRPNGNAPLPTVSGRTNAVEKVLIKQDVKLGVLDAQPPKSAPSLSKLAGQNSGPKTTVASKKQAAKHQAGGEVERLEDIAELGGELVFRRVAASPSSVSKLGTPSPKPAAPQAAPSKTASESENVDNLFEEGKERTEVKGGLAQNGKLGVNASKTPMAVYMKAVSGAIGAQWNALVKNRMDSLETGLVKVRFWISPEGKVRKVTIERSTANRQFSDLCLEAVQAALLQPPPVEAEPLLRDGLLEIPFTFSLY